MKIVGKNVALVEDNPLFTLRKANGVTVTDLWSMAKENQNMYMDSFVFPKDLSVTSIPVAGNFGLALNGSTMTKTALAQLCAKLNVPISYLRYCLKENANLLALDNLNTWLHRGNGVTKGNTLMLRDMVQKEKHYVRAVLTNAYSVYDSPNILQAILQGGVENFMYKNDILLKSFSLNYEGLHLRMISNKPLEVKSLDDKDLFVGIHLASSDVGLRSFSCQYVLLKLVCSNGMMISVGNELPEYHHIHKGINPDEFTEQIVAMMKNLPNYAEVCKIQLDALTDESYLVDKVREDENFRKSFSLRMGIGERAMVKSVLPILDSGRYHETSWGLLNAVTEYAQTLGIDRQVTVEEMVGKYVGELIA